MWRDIWECTLGGDHKVGLMQKIKLKITTAPAACSRILGDLGINLGYKGRFFQAKSNYRWHPIQLQPCKIIRKIKWILEADQMLQNTLLGTKCDKNVGRAAFTRHYIKTRLTCGTSPCASWDSSFERNFDCIPSMERVSHQCVLRHDFWD